MKNRPARSHSCQFLASFLLPLWVSLCSTAHPQEPARNRSPFEFVNAIGGTIQAIRRDGEVLYIGQGSVLRVLTRDSGSLRETASIPLDGIILSVNARRRVLYVLIRTYDNLRALEIIDVSNADDPKVVTPPAFKPADSPDVSVAMSESELIVLNGSICSTYSIADPLHPLLKRVDVSSDVGARPNDPPEGPLFSLRVDDLRMSGHVAFLLGEGKVHLVDVATPQNPKFVSRLIVDGECVALDSDANCLAVANGSGQVHLFDISKPLEPKPSWVIECASSISELQLLPKAVVLRVLDNNNQTSPCIRAYALSSDGYRETSGFIQADAKVNADLRIHNCDLLKYQMFGSQFWVDKNRDSVGMSYLALRTIVSETASEPVAEWQGRGPEDRLGSMMIAGDYAFLTRVYHTSHDNQGHLDAFYLTPDSLEPVSKL